LEVLKLKAIDKVKSLKNEAVLIGSGITAIGILFVIASIFVETLGLYVGIIIASVIMSSFVDMFMSNKGDAE
jgi:hypothetical protein